MTVVIETKLDSSCSSASVEVEDYTNYRLDRNGSGGGIMVYVYNTIKSEHAEGIQRKYNQKGLEVILLWLKLGTERILLIGIYRPPASKKEWFEYFMELLEEVIPISKVVVAGDLNSNLLDESAPSTKELMSCLEFANVEIDSVFPTRVGRNSATCLDIIALPKEWNCVLYKAGEQSASDHQPVIAKVNIHRCNKLGPITKRSFRKINDRELAHRVRSIVIQGNRGDPNEMLTSWQNQFDAVLDDLAPVRNYPRRKKVLPWVDKDVKEMISRRNKLAKRMMRQPGNDNVRIEHNLLRRRIKSQIRSKAKKYGEDKLRKNDTAGAWRFMREATFTFNKDRSIQAGADSLNAAFGKIVNDLNAREPVIAPSCDTEDSFKIELVETGEVEKTLRVVKRSSASGHDGIPGFLVKKLAGAMSYNITRVFNASIETGVFPDRWKMADVRPVYKQKGSKREANNYRPVSLLPILGRTFEKIVAQQLSNYCSRNDVVPVQQHGFRKFSSCETALIKATDTWMKAIDEGDIIGALLIDLSKAFDTIPHSTLVEELQKINVSISGLKWFSNYLSGRKQRVVTTTKERTDYTAVNRGVPQGSSLSPLLFNICIRDLPRANSCFTIQFADDITESNRGKSLQTIKESLLEAYDKTRIFCSERGLNINAEKTQFIVLKSPQRKLDCEEVLILDGIALQALKSVKLLGFHIDSHLTFGEHVSQTVSRCRGLLGVLRRASKTLPRKLLLMFYTGVIRSHLEYCASVLMSAAKTHLDKLETVQKIASRIIVGAPNRAHSDPIRESLELELLSTRRDKHLEGIIDKCQNSCIHPAVKELLDLGLGKPRTRYGKRCFSHLAAVALDSCQPG